MDEITLHRIDLLLKHCNEVISDTEGKTCDEFSSSNLQVRATCFSIVQVGEQLRVLKNKIGDAFPDIPWDESVSMRNFVVHDYSRVDSAQVYKVAMEYIPPLKDAFIEIKKSIDNKIC